MKNYMHGVQVKCVTKRGFQNQSFIDKLEEDKRALNETLKLRNNTLQKIRSNSYFRSSRSTNIYTEMFEMFIQELNSYMFPMYSRLRNFDIVIWKIAGNTITLVIY